MTTAAAHDRPIGGPRGNAALRVVREPIESYANLDRLEAEHHEWRVRNRASIAAAPGASAEEADQALEELEADLLSVTSTLARMHGTPDLGNKADPVDELVYIILSRRTREGAYQAAFDALRGRYSTWEELAAAPAGEIEATIRFSGLGRRKARSLKLALGALVDRFGACTLEPTRAWDDEATRAFLCTLPEIGPKSAACVMMCSLDRPAFPVDAHVGRVLERVGLFAEVGIDLGGQDHKAKQRMLWDAVPPALRYPLHVNLLVHGRAICLPRKPRCGACPISDLCHYGRMNPMPDSGRTPE